MKQKQNQQKQKRLFEKSAREAEKLIKKYKIDINQEVEILTQKQLLLPSWQNPAMFP